MLAVQLFVWWYREGWAGTAKNIGRMLDGVSHLFSVPILAQTMFAPWKRIVTYPGASLEAKMRAFGDNLVSRAIGFSVRFLFLLTALAVDALVLVGGMLSFVLWPLVPPGILALLILGVIG
jgi:hypothetical protein